MRPRASKAWWRQASLSATRDAPGGMEKVSPCQWKAGNSGPNPENRDDFAPPGRQAHRKPAYLALVVARHPAAQDLGQELGAETDSEHARPGLDGLDEIALLRAQPVEAIFVVHAHGAAHDHEEVHLLDGRQGFAEKDAGPGERMAPGHGVLRDGAGPFEGDVFNGVNAHGSFSFFCEKWVVNPCALQL